MIPTSAPADAASPGAAESAGGRLPLFLLAALLIAVALFRAPILFDDRTWEDENAVVLQGHGLYGVEWPAVFQRSQLRLDPSLSHVLVSVESGDYPPGMAVTAYLLRGGASPVRTLRWLFFVLGLCLVGVSYSTARLAGDRWLGLLAATYVACSPLFTHSSQQVKWNAVGPLLALVAANLLLRGSKTVRPAYVLVLALLLHLHYFCAWIVPAHLLYVAWLDRERLGRAAKEIGLALALAAPWYVVALPRQLEFVRGYFEAISQMPVDAWNTPFGLVSGARALGYDLLVGLGVLPSPIRGRYLSPLLLVATVCMVRALASAVPARKRAAGLAVVCLATATAGQTLYGLKVGNVVPLQPHYLCPWFPLLMVVVVLGAAEIGRRELRITVVGSLIGLSAATTVFAPLPATVLESDLPQDYAAVCRSLARNAAPDTAVVHPSESHAQMLNVACRLDGWQAVGVPAMQSLPPQVAKGIVLGRCGVPPTMPAGWEVRPERPCVGSTGFAIYERRPLEIASGQAMLPKQ